MTYMKMTRGPESSTSPQSPKSTPTPPKTRSIPDIIVNLVSLWFSMLLALVVVVNLIPTAAAVSSNPFVSVLTVGEILIVITIGTIMFGAIRLLRYQATVNRSAFDTTLLADKRPPAPSANESSKQLLKLTRSAEQLSEVENLLIYKLGANYRTDRVTDKLICQLQICTNRMIVQLGDLADSSIEIANNTEATKSQEAKKEKKNKTTSLQFWL